MHQARVFGHCVPTTGIVPFMRLVKQVMTTEPYASAKRVFWIVDTGPPTRRFFNAVMVHTPVHASWLNQVEYFSVVQRKVVSPNDFTDLGEVEQRLAKFEKRCNATAKPYQGKFTRDDLHDLLKRINQLERHEATTDLAAAA